MEALEARLGYTFRDRSLLENALMHSSYANENRARGYTSNERLEFLGDSRARHGHGDTALPALSGYAGGEDEPSACRARV